MNNLKSLNFADHKNALAHLEISGKIQQQYLKFITKLKSSLQKLLQSNLVITKLKIGLDQFERNSLLYDWNKNFSQHVDKKYYPFNKFDPESMILIYSKIENSGFKILKTTKKLISSLITFQVVCEYFQQKYNKKQIEDSFISLYEPKRLDILQLIIIKISMGKMTKYRYIKDPVLRRSIEQIKKKELLNYIAQFSKVCKLSIQGQFYDQKMNLTEFCFDYQSKKLTQPPLSVIKQKTKKIKKSAKISKKDNQQQKSLLNPHANDQNDNRISIILQDLYQNIENLKEQNQ